MTSTETAEATVTPALTSRTGFYRAPIAAATYRGIAQLVVGWLWAMVAGLGIFILVVVSVGLVPALGIGLVLLPLTLGLARVYAAVERGRIAAQTGVVIPEPGRRRPTGPGAWARLWAHLADPAGWRATAYALVSLILLTVFMTFAVAMAGGAVAGVIIVVRSLAAGGSVIGALAALVAVAVAAWFAALSAQAGTWTVAGLARSLLGPSATDAAEAAHAAQRAAESEARAAASAAAAAEQRADVLTETRAAALEAADSERRRIERDLHDGAQQRLVALGVTMGTARRAAERDPAVAVEALDHALGEVKETLAELRDLVRGIHPAVLSDRGLDAALSALAARSPVPVRVEAAPDLTTAGPTAQAAAYFVVAEALTNVAKHSEASRAIVRAAVVPAETGPVLRVEVSDDGRGGADAAPGGGLAGLRGRVAALDGTFDLTSPADAGTRLTVEVPCAS